MIGLYSALCLIGLWFLYSALFRSPAVPYRTVVQAAIMILLGAGGMAISFRKTA
jgi:hypothetical protein